MLMVRHFFSLLDLSSADVFFYLLLSSFVSLFTTTLTDYFSLDGCRRAVDEYRAAHNIDDEMIRIDGLSSYWRRGSGPKKSQ